MKKTVNFDDFRKEFEEYDKDRFSYKGLEMLYDYLIELEEDSGVELELDVIELCVSFTEYKSMEDFRGEHSGFYNVIENIEDETTVILVDEYENDEYESDYQFIIQNF